MKSSLTFRLYAGLTLCILLVLAVGFASYQTIRKQIVDSNWVNHSYKVINTSQQIRNRLLRIETNKIAYRETREEYYLKVIDSLRSGLPQLSDSLIYYTRDNPKQNRLAADIQHYIGRVLLFWDRANRDVAQLDSDLIREEDALFNSFNRKVDIFQSVENSILRKRTETSAYLAKITVRVIIIGLSIVFAIVIVLWYAIRKELASRLSAQKELRSTLKHLEQVNTDAEQKNWQLEGLAKINSQLQESPHDLKNLTQGILDTMRSYAQVPAAIFYVYDEDLELLTPVASYAVPGERRKTVKLGENLAGQAALRESISEVTNIPNGYWRLESGLGIMEAAKILYLPLYEAKKLKGLIELVAQTEALAFETNFLELIAANVAKALNNCMAHTKMQLLIEQVNLQNEELRTQKEDLFKSHEKIKVQAEELSASEEELRVQQEELLQLNAELETQNQALERTRQAIEAQKEALEKSSRYKSEFLANMSHELRTPLNSILVLSKLLSENPSGNLTEKQRDYSKVIHKSGSDLLELINDILDLSKIEAGKVEIVFEKVQLREVVEQMETLFREIAEERGLKFELHLEPDTPDTLVTDQRRLEQILKNLLSNAFKFTPSGGKVQLNVRLQNENEQRMLCFEVVDNGIGIPKEKQNEVFLAFQQIEGTINRKYTGTGLGLSISTELVKRLGGFITLESETDKGSTFAVFLPLKPTTETLNYQPIDVAKPEHNATLQPVYKNEEKKKILIVDNAAGLGKSVDSLLTNKPDVLIKHVLSNIAPASFSGETYDLLIYCLDDNFKDSILQINELKNFLKDNPYAIILLIDRDISAQEEMELRTVSHTIINQSEKAEERLSDEIDQLLRAEPASLMENQESGIYSSGLKGKTILIADDDMRNIFSLSALLEEHGAQVVVANNGTEALEELEKDQVIALVLMDIMMPVMDGFEAITRIRKQIKFRELPIIALTAKAMLGDRERCMQAGASDYITKPVDTDQLLNLINIWLRKQA